MPGLACADLPTGSTRWRAWRRSTRRPKDDLEDVAVVADRRRACEVTAPTGCGGGSLPTVFGLSQRDTGGTLMGHFKAKRHDILEEERTRDRMASKLLGVAKRRVKLR